jgi:hypothetical protein
MDRYGRKIATAVVLIVLFVTFGTFFFHFAEGWSYVDSFYFSGVTLTTVGYGDITPTHAFSKIMTVFFAFMGIGIIFYSVSVIAQHYFERQEQTLHEIWTDGRHPVRQMARSVDHLARDAGVHDLAHGMNRFARDFAERKGLKKKTEFVPIERIGGLRGRR